MRLFALLPLLVACNKGAEGTVALSAWGEDAAFEGFPNEELSFADGWTLSFDAVVANLTDIELADPDTEEVVAGDDGNYLVDLAQAVDPAAITTLSAPEGRYRLSYAVVPPTAGATNVNGAPAEAVDAMVANGYRLYVKGTASKDGADVTFTWGFPEAYTYRFCENGADGTDGVALVADEELEAELTLHIDHIWWDQLGVEEASLRFAPMAAWAGDDNDVTLDELAAASVPDLRDPDGNPITDETGQNLFYDDAGLGITNLRDFVLFSSIEMAHMNGIGECEPVDR
jgi:hypothetical protein